MSVIYDALRRTEVNVIGSDDKDRLEKPRIKKNPKKFLPIILVVAVLVLAFLSSSKLFLGSKFINSDSAGDDNKERSKKVPNLAPGLYGSIKKDGFVLSGVAYDEFNAWAVINNKILKQGDLINKAKLTKISKDEVELSLDENKRIVLSSKQ